MFFFGHKNKAVHVFLHGVLEIVLLKAAVFNMQYSSLFCVVFALKEADGVITGIFSTYVELDKLVICEHEVGRIKPCFCIDRNVNSIR